MDICSEDNIYLFIARNRNNSIKIYSIDLKHNPNGTLMGIIKANSFVSIISKKDSTSFFSGHLNGKLIEWEIEYKEMKRKASIVKRSTPNKKIISNIILKREIIAHNYAMITSINYNERYNIVLTSDNKGLLFIRKYYDFELLTKIDINNNQNSCFINKIFLNDYDIICTINYNTKNCRKFLSFYSINGILLEKSADFYCMDACVLKNGKIICNRINKGNNLYLFGFNGKIIVDNKIGDMYEDSELSLLDNNIKNIKNFVIENNTIYILSKNGKFIKAYYNRLDQLSYGVDIFD
jgi:hypothetical protein